MAIASLAYKITADTRGFSKEINATRKEMRAARAVMEETRAPSEKLQDSLAGLERLYEKGLIDLTTYTRAQGKLQAELGQTTSKVNRLGRALRGIGGGLKGIGGLAKRAALPIAGLGAAAGGFAVQAIKMAAEVEQNEVAFSKLTGSVQTARELMGDLQGFAASTPFQLPGITDAARKLAAFGTETDDIIPTLRVLGDISAGTGNDIGEVAEIFGKARVSGRLFAEDINQLVGRGIPVIGALAAELGVAESEIKGLVSEGRIGFPELQNAFVRLTSEGSQFGGMMAEQSQTLAGSFSTLKDSITQAMVEIGQGIAAGFDLTAVAQHITQFVAIYKQDFVTEVTDGVKFIGDAWDVLLKAVEFSKGVFYGLRAALNVVFSGIGQSINTLIVGPLQAVVGTLETLTGKDLGGQALENISTVIDNFATDMVKAGQDDWRKAGEAMAAAFGEGKTRQMFNDLGEQQATAQAEQLEKLAPSLAAKQAEEDQKAAGKAADKPGRPDALNRAILKGSAEALAYEAKLSSPQKKQTDLLSKIERNTRTPAGGELELRYVGLGE